MIFTSFFFFFNPQAVSCAYYGCLASHIPPRSLLWTDSLPTTQIFLLAALLAPSQGMQLGNHERCFLAHLPPHLCPIPSAGSGEASFPHMVVRTVWHEDFSQLYLFSDPGALQTAPAAVGAGGPGHCVAASSSHSLAQWVHS